MNDSDLMRFKEIKENRPEPPFINDEEDKDWMIDLIEELCVENILLKRTLKNIELSKL